jgi:G3E family GTPase
MTPVASRTVHPIPVIALTGYLGAGKTTLLNHVLRTPDARIGVVVNDFGELNVDAGLVTGQVDEPASIAGGCICCLPDDGGLDVALARLADPKLRLDAIIVEASGLADPVAISRIIRFSGVDGIRPGGVVDVLDAARHFHTVDRDASPPARYGAATLVVVNKLDQVRPDAQEATLRRVTERVRERNPHAHVVGATAGRIDPALLYDVAADEQVGQLTFRELLNAAEDDEHDHVHADAVTVRSEGCVDPGALIDLLEEPPLGVYRMKGTVAVRYRGSVRRYVVNVVGASVHVAAAPVNAGLNPMANSLVAIGMHLDVDAVRAAAGTALAPVPDAAAAQGIRRLQRYRRLSI